MRGDVFVSSNGNVQFAPNLFGADWNNFRFPAGNYSMAAPYFDDMYLPAGGQLGYFDGNGVRAVTWQSVPYFPGRSAVTFQVAFLASGAIEMRYGTMGSPPGGTADSGVAVGTATIGLTFGNVAAVPSLGRIANRPDIGISDSGGIVNAGGLAALDQLPGNDILVFVPDGSGNY